MTLNVALLGAGRIGTVHATAVQKVDGAKVVLVADAIPAAAEKLAREFGADVAALDDAIVSPKVDAVLICTPTDTHADLIRRAVAAGKAVFCEKPVDLASSIVEELNAYITSAKGKVMIGFNRRFDPHFAALKRRIVAGEIGNVESVLIISRDPAPPPISYIARSGGIFRDMTIHDFDMARWLIGEEFVEVHAVGSCLVDPEIGKAGDYDTAAITLKTASGRIAQITNTRRATYGYDQRAEVHGSKGMLRIDNPISTTVQLANASGYSTDPLMDFFMQRYADAYRAEITLFVETLKSGAVFSPSIADGLAAQRIADAATQSAQTGLPVKL